MTTSAVFLLATRTDVLREIEQTEPPGVYIVPAMIIGSASFTDGRGLTR